MVRFLRQRVNFDIPKYILLILTVILILPTSSFCDDLSSAKAQKDKAYQDYYTGLRTLGPNATPEQLSQLRARTLNPAMSNWTQAVTAFAAEKTYELQRKIIEMVKKHISGLSFKDSSPATSKKKFSTSSSEESAPEQPGLDGSKVPKELTFRGKKTKQNQRIKPAPSSTPTQIRMNNRY